MGGKVKCGTPDSVYTTVLGHKHITLRVKFPFALLRYVPEGRKQHLIRTLHNGIIPAIEQLYADNWERVRQNIPELYEVSRWEDLFDAVVIVPKKRKAQP